MKIELGKDLEKASLPALAVFTFEEDAGKSMHDEVDGRADSRIDLNRTGTPLLEIVSEPDMRSPLEARSYLNELKLMLTYLNVSDCNMQEGSLRVDANINLHLPVSDGTMATPIVEVKNMNSFRAVERAMEFLHAHVDSVADRTDTAGSRFERYPAPKSPARATSRCREAGSLKLLRSVPTCRLVIYRMLPRSPL